MSFSTLANRAHSLQMKVMGKREPDGRSGIIYFPKRAGGSFSIRGVYDEDYIRNDPDIDEPLSDVSPILGVDLNEFPEHPQKDDELSINGVRFRVHEVREDSEKGADLYLHRISE